MGTLITAGKGTGIVITTGSSTEFGQVWKSLQGIEKQKTPLQIRMDILGRQLSLVGMQFAHSCLIDL